MQEIFFTFRSVTYAQEGERVLRRAGIPAYLRRTPARLAKRGCGYTVVVRPRDEARAQALFDREAVACQNVYRMEGSP